MPGRVTIRRRSFGGTGSDSMKPILLLNDETENVRLALEEVTSGGMARHESEARAGCNCDRWGHPYAGCLDRKKNKRSPRSNFISIQTASLIDGISNRIHRCGDDDSLCLDHRSLPTERVIARRRDLGCDRQTATFSPPSE